jgi:hypothetical protein
MIKVYQVGHEAHKSMYPETPFSYGMGKFDPVANIKHYEHVANLDASDLDEAFQIGNIGPEEAYTRFKPMHSVSVGDILVEDCGTVSIVAGFGFDKLEGVSL